MQRSFIRLDFHILDLWGNKLKKLIIILLLASLASSVSAVDYNHARFATITYSSSAIAYAPFVAAKYTMAVNPSGAFYDSLKYQNTGILCIRYLIMSTYRSSDYSMLSTFCTAKGYTYDSMFMWVHPDSTTTIVPIAPYGRPCTDSATITSNGDDSLGICIYSAMRTAPNFTKTEVQEFIAYKYRNEIITVPDSQYDGAMADEPPFYYHPNWDYYDKMACFPFKPDKWSVGSPSSVRGFENMTHDQVRDSMKYLKQNVWLPVLMDSLFAWGMQRFPNPAAYGVLGSDIIDDCIETGSGVLFGEGMDVSSLDTDYSAMTWSIMDTLVAADTGEAIIWMEVNAADTSGLGSLARAKLERLAFYYMAHQKNRHYLMISNGSSKSWEKDADTAFNWADVFAWDIGLPDSARYDDTTGTDGAAQSFTVVRRDFTRASDSRDVIVLYRIKNGTDYSATSDVTVQLGGNYQVVNSDTTYESAASTVDIANCEGIILLGEEVATSNRVNRMRLRN